MSRRFDSQAEADAWLERSRDPDNLDARALIQGALVASCMKAPEVGIAVVDVDQDVDAEGDYESHFVVNMRSGARIRVTIDVE